MAKFHSVKIFQKARKLREKGISTKEITKQLHIEKTTILRWCADIPSKNPFHLYAQKLRENEKKKSTKIVKRILITEEKAKFLASILYWCEGAKYPSTNFVAFTNSDINLVKTFLKLFRLGFHPVEDKIRIHLQLHTTHNKKKVLSFWSSSLDIPKSQFYKPTITKPTKNRKRMNYMGTCTIRYYRLYSLLEITGIFEEFLKKVIRKGG